MSTDSPFPHAPTTEAAWEELRARAEATLGGSTLAEDPTTAAQIDRLIHELRVHQIELELQNEELRNAQEELQLSRDRFADLYDFSPVAYLTVSAAGLIEGANLTAASLFGAERGSLLGTPFSSYVSSAREDQDAYYRQRTAALDSDAKVVCELRMQGPGGEPFHARLESVAVAPGCPESGALRVVVVDVTERRQAEVELRTARDGALAADRAKSEFLANMSHEVRTPLSGILGMAEVLSGMALNPDQRECVEHIRLSGKLLLGIVNDILDLSRIEAVGVDLQVVEFALREVVEDTVHLHAETAHAKGLELCCLLGREVPAQVMGDPGRLRQILFNLVGNAIKFTQRGQVVVRARLDEEHAEGAMVRVEVEDTGIGIHEADQAGIFEDFVQADPSSSRGFGGSGLGLPICRRLVQAMGGTIGFQSETGRGSRFWFTADFAVVPTTKAGPIFDGTTALVVEPQPTSRAFLLEQLARLGMEATGAADRADGLRLAADAESRGRPFRVVLVALDLPGGGADLARAMEEQQGSARLGVILLTRFGARGLAGETGADGLHRYLRKPVREWDLARCVEAALCGQPCLPEVSHGVAPDAVGWRGDVLLAEDTPVNQAVMVELLRREGYRAEVVADGAGAVAAALARSYDLVLMDWQMPGVDGLEATRRIRGAPGPNQRVPIVAITAHTMADHRQACLDAGMDDHLCKPVEPVDLARVLDRWGGGSSSGHPGSGVRAVGDRTGPVLNGLAGFRDRFSEETVGKFVESFQKGVPRSLAVLRVGAERNNGEEVSEGAHQLRGTCALLGVKRTCEVLKTLELLGDQGDLEGAGALVDEVAADLEEIGATLATWIRQGGGENGKT